MLSDIKNIAVISECPEKLFTTCHQNIAFFKPSEIASIPESVNTVIVDTATMSPISNISTIQTYLPYAKIIFVAESFTESDKVRLSSVQNALFVTTPIQECEVNALTENADIRSGLDVSDEMVILADDKGSIVAANKLFKEKYPTVGTLVAISPSCLDNLKIFSTTGKPVRFETQNSKEWFEIYMTKARNGLIAIFAQDITAKKQSEKYSNQNEKRHLSLAVLGQMYEAEFEDILEYALDSAVEQSESTDGSISILDKDSGSLKLVASRIGDEKHLYSIQEQLPVAHEYATDISTVLNENEPVISNDTLPKHMIVPMLAQGGVRMILIVRGKNLPYTHNDATGLMHYMESVWRLKERKDAEEQISRLNDELEQMIKQRTSQLKESENRFRTAFESTTNGMAIISISGTLIQVNRAFAEMLGFAAEELNGKSIYSFLHKEYLEISKKYLNMLIKGEKASYSAIKKYRHKDGSYKTVSVNSALAKNADGKPLYLVTQLVDITEAERTRTERDRIFEHSHDIICVASLTGEIRYANSVFYNLFGGKASDHHPINIAELFTAEETSRAKTFLTKLLSGKNIIDHESAHKTIAGETIWLSWFASADSENKLVYVIARNITERKKYETSLKKAIDEAEKANMAKSQFIANISHEIRTPLNAVIGFSELLAARVTDEKSRSFANSIKSSGKTLLNLINDILDISKLEAKAVQAEKIPADIRYLVKEIVNIFSVKALTKGITVTGHVEDSVPRAMLLDVSRIRQILLNLAGNAVKFTENGYVKILVTAEPLSGRKVTLRISVKDSGIGIPESDFDTIFEPFRQRADRTMKAYGGTGLGLSISKKLAEILGGQITVKSFVGHGSTFSLILPKVDTCDVTLRKLPASRRTRFKPAKVLIVDDDESSRNMLKEMLESCGLFVMEAQNGAAAQLIAREAIPSLIFMDIRMPDMDGYKTASMIRADPNTTAIPIIALTAAMEEKNRDNLFNDFLYKPADLDIITTCASKYLNMTFLRSDESKPLAKTDAQIVKTAFADSMPENIKLLLNKAPKAVAISYAQKLCDTLKVNNDKATDVIADRMQSYIDNIDIDKLKRLIEIMCKFA